MNGSHDDAAATAASARLALGLSFAVCWFLFGAVRYAAGALQALPWLFFEDMPNRAIVALLGLLALAAFAAPLLPLGARWSREDSAVRAGIAAIVAGLLLHAGLAAPLGWLQRHQYAGIVLTVCAAVVATAAGALFLNAVVGLVNRRAVAGGLVGAILLGQIVTVATQDATGFTGLRIVLAGSTMLAIAGVWLALRWRAAPAEERVDTFERRAGGMRMRGGIALGLLLFFELTEGLWLGSLVDPPFASPRETAAWLALGMVPPAFALWFVLAGNPIRRHRALAVTLAAVVTLGALYAKAASHDYLAGAAANVAAHSAALMLLGRALAPASGRRSGRKLALGLGVFALANLAWSADLMLSGGARSGFSPGYVALVAVAGVVLAVATYLTPRAAAAPPPLAPRTTVALAAAVPAITLLVAFF